MLKDQCLNIVANNDFRGKDKNVPVSLSKNKIYRAKLIWRKEGYKSIELKEYYLVPRNTHADFYEDPYLKVCKGCFPLHWFTGFLEVGYIIEETRNEKEIVVDCSKLVLPLPEEEELNEEYEQLALF